MGRLIALCSVIVFNYARRKEKFLQGNRREFRRDAKRVVFSNSNKTRRKICLSLRQNPREMNTKNDFRARSCRILGSGIEFVGIVFEGRRREPSSIDERKSWRGRAVTWKIKASVDRPRYNNFGYNFLSSLSRLHLPLYIFFFLSSSSSSSQLYVSPLLRLRVSSDPK